MDTTEYLQNLHQIRERSNFRPDLSASPEAQIDFIRSEAQELNRLQSRNNEILNQLFYQKDPENLTDAEAKEWFDFACYLVNDYEQTDLGLAYQLHTRLLRRARALGQWDAIVEELYYCGVTLHYFNIMVSNAEKDVYYQQVREYFEEGASFLESFEQLDDKTRRYILRCLGNIRLGYPCFVPDWATEVPPELYRPQLECFDRAYAVMTDARLRAIAPDLPWDDYVYALHFGRTTLLSLVRVDDRDPQLRRLIYESACFIYERQERAAQRRQLALSSRTIYVYAAARYHYGLLSAPELVDILLEQTERAEEGDGMANLIYRRLSLLPYLQFYLSRCPEPDRARLMPRVTRAEQASMRFVKQIPMTDYFSQAIFYVRNTVMVSITTGDATAMQKRTALLRWFLACHRPTYVHSLMVSWLTKAILRRLLEVDPDIMNREIAGVWRCTGNLHQFFHSAGEAALFHDVGKISLLDIVSNYGRRLTDEEFRLIQLHPEIGYWMLSGIDGMQLCAEAAQNHHRFYNELGGYPRLPGRRRECACNLLNDAITVADSIEAGTDDIGRSYAKGKSLDTLVQELREGYNKRYAGYIVDIFDDDAFRAQLSARMNQTRRKIYCTVYTTKDTETPAPV